MAGRQRVERVREEIKKEASDILFKLKDPRIGFVTITDVEASADLSVMKIFVSVMGEQADQTETIEALDKAKGFVRTELGRRIRLRHTPEIQFKLDDSMERGARIFQLLKEIRPNEEA